MKRIAITGGYGFLGWHTACRLLALHGLQPVRLGREDLMTPERLIRRLSGVDALMHIAGVSRARPDEHVEQGNILLAKNVSAAISRLGQPIDAVYANTTQAILDNPYGRGKARAAELLRGAVRSAGGHFADLLLPNLFGEHGRPDYNSFVATFTHEVVEARKPTVTGDREVPLLHVQDAAAALIDKLGTDDRVFVAGEPIGISQVLQLLQEFHTMYAIRGEVPDISTAMRRNLFNTYRAAAFPQMWPIFPQVRDDDRGGLFEAVRAHGPAGMSFVSSTRPGQTRGEHYHMHKVERFMVIQGEAEIALRRLLHDEVVTFKLSGEAPAFVDMPTLWVHNIRNVGETDLITLFWSDQLLDPANPDQYPQAIAQETPT